MKKNKTKRKGVIYSTNNNYKFEYENHQIVTLPNNQQNLRIFIEKYKAGKIAVIIKGFIGNDLDLKSLAKNLKAKCGVGGSTKNGEIIIQGNNREKIISILEKEGDQYKRVGG